MFQRSLTIFLLIALYTGGYFWQRGAVHAFSLPASYQDPTIPTRTATPPPNPPTATPGDGGGGDNPTSVPPTGVPPAIDMPSPTATLAPTVAGGFLPTAEPCSNQPTLQAFNTIFTRSGPGTDYPITHSLVYLEVRPIFGRSAHGEWWYIQLADGSHTWVGNVGVTIQGYIGAVPIIPAPPIEGNTPTPGVPWNPTSLPFCTVTPTATSTHTATPTLTVTATPSPDVTADNQTRTASNTAVEAPSSTPIPPSPTVALAIATPEEATAVALALPTAPPPTPAPLETDSDSGTSLLLPIAGLVLIVAGFFGALVWRRGDKALP